jgi:hypothetical protein
MNRIAKTVGSFARHDMNRALRIIQLNVRKQGAVHESLLNDEDTQIAVALAIQGPQARRIHGRLLTTRWDITNGQTWFPPPGGKADGQSEACSGSIKMWKRNK